MAEIHGKAMTDEQFMLVLELGQILKEEGYTGELSELEPSKVKSQRGQDIITRLMQIANGN